MKALPPPPREVRVEDVRPPAEMQLGLDEACRAASPDIVEMWSHPDQEEGPAAFADKRPANWAPPRSGE